MNKRKLFKTVQSLPKLCEERVTLGVDDEEEDEEEEGTPAPPAMN